MLHAAALQQYPVLQQSANLLGQYFLNPVGLLALLALIPLLIIYLMRPEPEERVMPSMEFFMEKKRSGRVQKALRRLQRNLLLLLHVFFIGLLAAALAGPYITGQEAPENAVVVVDRSASMADDLGNVRDFVARNAGTENTLILAGEEVSVPLEGAGRQRLLGRVNGVEARDVETDVRGALQVASGYDGRLVLASDLDQTVGEGDAVEEVERLEASGRQVAVMQTSQGNRWGVVGLEPSRGNTSVDVKNFMGSGVEVRLSSGGSSRSLSIPAGAVETVKVETPAGRTEIRLESDPVPADNTAFVSVPEQRSFRVLLVSDEGNPYLEKAVELINFTSVETVNPPLNRVPDADVYVVGRTDRILGGTVREIEDRVRNGASAVFFSQHGIFGKASSLPAERRGGVRNVTVEIEEPRRVLVGETQVFDVKRTRGESLANDNALVRSGHGEGEVVLYNIRDSDFHFDFLYPVFWKELLAGLTERPTVGEHNLETGEELGFTSVTLPGGEEVEGPVRMTETGFYGTSGGTFSANLLSEDESEEEVTGVEEELATGGSLTEKPLKHYAVALLLLLALGEFGYLRWRGSL